jgi:8-oxo-dGTP pyrophosphatase MutT (NUDIX family)
VKDFIINLEEKLASPLPGLAVQLEMAPSIRKADVVVPDDAKLSAVMLLLFQREGQWHTLLIERSSNNPNDKHSGQISFPGGKLEASDISFEACAKREAFEEVGIAIDAIRTVGALTPLYIPVSRFMVYPFVGVLAQEPVWKPQASEVKKLLPMPVSFFADKKNIKMKDMIIMGQTVKDVPYYDVDGKALWGATSMILYEFSKIFDNV